MERISALILCVSCLSACAQPFTSADWLWQHHAAASSGAGSFTYYSTVFNGSSYAQSTLAGTADGKQGTFSAWVKFTSGDGSLYSIFTGLNAAQTVNTLAIQRAADNTIQVIAKNSGGTAILSIASSATVTVSSGWVHLFCSWDLSAGVSQIYINGVSSGNNNINNNDTIPYSGDSFEVAGYAGNNFVAPIKVSEVWFTEAYLSSPGAFRAGSHPANLGANGSTPTGSQPLVYLHNAYSSFQTNLGSGGNFTVTGSLTDGGSDLP